MTLPSNKYVVVPFDPGDPSNVNVNYHVPVVIHSTIEDARESAMPIRAAGVDAWVCSLTPVAFLRGKRMP